jgi:WD40 repeat protein
LVVVTDKGAGSVHTDLKKHDGTQRSEASKERKMSSIGEPLTSVVITGDSKWVFVGTFDGKVHVWDASNGKVTGEVKL